MDTGIQKAGNQAISPERGGIMKSDGLGGMELEVRSEIHAAAAAAKEEGWIRAKFQFALARPRDIDLSMTKLFKRCEDPFFADEAIYSKPVGGQMIEGLSVRFTEEAVRCLGNISSAQYTSSEDRFVRRLVVMVVDLENNVDYSGEVTLEKTVERKNKTGRICVGERPNSSGQTVYTVLATEDELTVKQNAAISKLKRTLQLNLIPGDMQARARRKCEETLANKNKGKNPADIKNSLLEAFAKVGVYAPAIRAYLSKENLDFVSEPELNELRGLLKAIQSGEISWNDAFEEKTGRSATEVVAPEQQAQPKPDAQGDLVDPNTGEVTPAAAATVEATPVSDDEPQPDPTAQPVEEFLWRVSRATPETIEDLAREMGARRAAWGAKASTVGAKVSAKRKELKGGR